MHGVTAVCCVGHGGSSSVGRPVATEDDDDAGPAACTASGDAGAGVRVMSLLSRGSETRLTHDGAGAPVSHTKAPIVFVRETGTRVRRLPREGSRFPHETGVGGSRFPHEKGW
ncbi:hypothetical protein GCM10022241_13510 [Micrococcus endophyticus]